LLSLLTSLIVGSILNIFFSISIIDNIITGCLIILFSFYIMYDTQLIIGGKHHKKSYNSDDYIIASLSLYQDVISLFMKILKFMGKLKEKNRD
jgi:FtsH-binding integral membrane protein